MKRINEAVGGKGSHVIVGNDADIILMSLMSPVKQLYILSQQSTGKGSRFSCISFDALNMLRSTDVASFSLAPVSALQSPRLVMTCLDGFCPWLHLAKGACVTLVCKLQSSIC